MRTRQVPNRWETSFRYTDEGDICEARVVTVENTAVIAVVSLDNASTEDQRAFNDRAEADTRLIASAPDLLEVVQGVLELWDDNGERNYYTASIGVLDLRDMAEEAMAKVTGKGDRAEQGFLHNGNRRGTIPDTEDESR